MIMIFAYFRSILLFFIREQEIENKIKYTQNTRTRSKEFIYLFNFFFDSHHLQIIMLWLFKNNNFNNIRSIDKSKKKECAKEREKWKLKPIFNIDDTICSTNLIFFLILLFMFLLSLQIRLLLTSTSIF